MHISEPLKLEIALTSSPSLPASPDKPGVPSTSSSSISTRRRPVYTLDLRMRAARANRTILYRYGLLTLRVRRRNVTHITRESRDCCEKARVWQAVCFKIMSSFLRYRHASRYRQNHENGRKGPFDVRYRTLNGNSRPIRCSISNIEWQHQAHSMFDIEHRMAALGPFDVRYRTSNGGIISNIELGTASHARAFSQRSRNSRVICA